MNEQERAALWASWSQNFFNGQVIAMSETISRVFMNVVMLELANDANGVAHMVEETKGYFPYQVLTKRAEFVGLDLSEPAKIFLCCLSNSPGTLVMYVYALRYWQLTNDGQPVTASSLASTFPMGFLTDQSLSEMWDAQKVELEDRTMNLLDTLSKENLQVP